MRKLLLIGIGSGDPEHLTVQAIRALNQVDVFFVLDKGSGPRDLIRLRQEICERYIDGDGYRFVEAEDVPRGSRRRRLPAGRERVGPSAGGPLRAAVAGRVGRG